MDLRKTINLISDVVNNRPMPIRELDQIYMKHADILLQIEHITKWFLNKSVVFIGDGDAIALGIAYLQANKELENNISNILVLDFDERIVNSINEFAIKQNLSEIIKARLYNVADALPEELWQTFDCFYCNPPYGSSNDGVSISSFMKRGFEATNENAIGCIVIADVPDLSWTRHVLQYTQSHILDNGFIISEMVPRFHTYHLEDDPDLTSCSIIVERFPHISGSYNSIPLSDGELEKFYGIHEPLKYKYIKDMTQRKHIIPDYELIPFDKGNNNESKE